MKKIFNHLKSRVIAGVIFLIPLFAIILIIQKLWKTLTGAGNYLVQLFGLNSLLGSHSVTIATAVLLILLFYFFGWLVKVSALNRVRDWMETGLLQYIPGYLTYKAQLQEKISPTKDKRIPVYISSVSGKRPGLLVEEQADDAIIFFPNSPDSNNGEVIIVPRQQVTKLNIDASSFLKSLQKFGKGLYLAKP
jgi:uncharacterized membrane protein